MLFREPRMSHGVSWMVSPSGGFLFSLDLTPVDVGGKSALDWHGVRHYVCMALKLHLCPTAVPPLPGQYRIHRHELCPNAVACSSLHAAIGVDRHAALDHDLCVRIGVPLRGAGGRLIGLQARLGASVTHALRPQLPMSRALQA